MGHPTSIEITLDLDSHLGRFVTYDEDGEVTEPTTLEDVVLGLAARKLVDQLLSGARYGGDQGDAVKALRSKLIDQAEALAAKRVAAHVEAAFEQLVHEVSEDGSQVFSQTLREAIVRATEHATTFRQGTRGDLMRQSKSTVERLIAEHVDRTVEREVKEAIDEAKNTARAEVSDRASKAIAAALAPKRGGF